MRLRPVLATAFVGIQLAACMGLGDSSERSTNNNGSGVNTAPCSHGQLRCEGSCVDVESSRTSCGACGSLCATRCEAGICQRAPLVAIGDNTTCALLSAGELKCWGINLHGQLGYGDNESRSAPGDNVTVDEEITQISEGGAHTCVRLVSGSVRCWGENAYGQLGYGDNDARMMPDHDILIGANVFQIMAAHGHTCAVFESGELKCWGLNDQGQLGYGDTQDRSSPGANVNLKERAIQVVGGYGHTCALLVSGKVKCWGLNHFGQLGYTDPTSRNTPGDAVSLDGKAIQLDATLDQTCALLASGQVQCWGANESGQLGSSDVSPHFRPGPPIALGEPALQIALGFAHSCALLSSGNVKCWGANDFGQLGYANTTPLRSPGAEIDLGGRVVQIAAGNGHSCALLEDDSLMCWGWNQNGQLGYGNTSNIGDNETPVSVGAISFE